MDSKWPHTVLGAGSGNVNGIHLASSIHVVVNVKPSRVNVLSVH